MIIRNLAPDFGQIGYPDLQKRTLSNYSCFCANPLKCEPGNAVVMNVSGSQRSRGP